MALPKIMPLTETVAPIEMQSRVLEEKPVKLACTVRRQGNERNHVANLAIESAADSVQYFGKGPMDGNRLKKLFFRAQ